MKIGYICRLEVPDAVNHDMDYFGNGKNLRSIKNNRFFYSRLAWSCNELSHMYCVNLIVGIFVIGRSFFCSEIISSLALWLLNQNIQYSLYPSKDSFSYKYHILSALQTPFNFCLHWNMIPNKQDGYFLKSFPFNSFWHLNILCHI